MSDFNEKLAQQTIIKHLPAIENKLDEVLSSYAGPRFIEVTRKRDGGKVLLALATIQRLEQVTWQGANHAQLYYTDKQYSGGLGDVEVQETFEEVARRIGQAQKPEPDLGGLPIA